MKKLLFSLWLVFPFLSFGQAPSHPKYVKGWGENESFSSLYSAWKQGNPLSIDRADDEEFFISRVKPRTRFEDKETQVNQSATTDRKLLWWVPCGISDWNAMPSYFFNSEVFSTWSYIDHWGNWTATYLRMPAAFTDVAHKNGVSVSCTATMGFGVSLDYNDNSWGQNMYTVADGGADKYIRFLKFYGMDGAGYNSEANLSYSLNYTYKNFLAEASEWAKQEGLYNYSNIWYGITDGAGRMSSPWDALTDVHVSWFEHRGKIVSTHYFLNYNWNNYYLQQSVETATRKKRSSYDVYAGINMQKGSGVKWRTLMNSPVSIGIWGAHNANMIFENRGSAGASAISQQEEYQKASESIFTGGYRNPLIHYDYGSTLPSGSGSASRFFGFSKEMPARSSLHGDISKQPFVTYFNLGNGQFFNLEGVRRFDNEWYNIGIQDFLPSWRWWISNKFMGHQEADVPAQSLSASFTWEDAWFGGSCLEIKGQTKVDQYIHLFKTKYGLLEGDNICVRYKVVNGSGDMDLSVAVSGESTEYEQKVLSSDEINYGEWVEVNIPIRSSGRNSLQVTDKTLSMIGLKFSNTTPDFSVRIGEISLTRGDYATPNKPRLKKSVSLENNFKGVDFKILYSMDEQPLKDGLKTYNEDVNVWYFKIYSQQEGQEPQFCTATTSWASYVVGAKIDAKANRRFRYGVSAVSLDGKHESEIAWSDYQELNNKNIIEGIKVDKSIVNKNEMATVSFSDPDHEEALKWEVKDDDNVITSQDGGKSFSFSLSNIGSYTIVCKLKNGQIISKSSFVTVVPVSAGSYPEIKTITANGNTDKISIKPDEYATIRYTSRNSDGAVSRALVLKNASFKVPNLYSKLGVRLGNNGSMTDGGITVSFWFNPEKTVYADGQDGTRMFDISKASERWPMSEWGYFWINYGQGHDVYSSSRPSYQGFTITDMNQGYDSNNAREKIVDTKEYKLEPRLWYHMTVQIGYDLSSKIFINGKEVDSRPASSTRTTLFNDTYELNISKYVKFASTFDGLIDEVRIYNKVLSETDIPNLMRHLDDVSGEVSKGLKAYFDFEDDANSNGYFESRVGSDVFASVSRLNWIGEGNQEWQPIKDFKFGASTAMVEGDSYKIVTSPRWSSPKGQFSDQSNDKESGSTKVKWQKEGAYPVVLSLENAWGTDTKVYNVVNVGATPDAVNSVSSVDLSVYPNPFCDNLRLRFAKDGDYTLSLYDASGIVATEKKVSVIAGTLYSIDVNVPSGLYILNVSLDGVSVASVKLQKK